jgi:hypothetical protein
MHAIGLKLLPVDNYNRNNEIPILREVAKCYLLISVSEKQRSVDSILKDYGSSQNCFQKNYCKICLRTASTVFSCTVAATSAHCTKMKVILKKVSVLWFSSFGIRRKTLPIQTDPYQTKSNQTQTIQIKPNRTKPIKIRPNQTKTKQAKPNQTKPNQSIPNQKKPNQTKLAASCTV